jgi:hypothetical protein
MIVWGGYDNAGPTQTGGRYNPITDTWIPTSTAAANPSARYYHTAVWSGSAMIVWGGQDVKGAALASGALYAPATDSWTPTPAGAGSPSARTAHAAIWTGTDMIIWGGRNGSAYFNDGASFTPAGNFWTPTPSLPI